jgi:hypothetical protein
VIPDDTAGRPLTPGERAAIADLERRLLLDAPAPVRDRVAVARPARFHGSTSRRPFASPVVPLVALLGTGVLLVVLAAVVGTGLLGVVAVLVSVVATALAWPLLPAGLGGPVRLVPRPRRGERRRGRSRRGVA